MIRYTLFGQSARETEVITSDLPQILDALNKIGPLDVKEIIELDLK